MKFTIIYQKQVFETDYFEYQADYQTGMVVINNISRQYSPNGIDWYEIERQ